MATIREAMFCVKSTDPLPKPDVAVHNARPAEVGAGIGLLAGTKNLLTRC
jgi:hypothetical protein